MFEPLESNKSIHLVKDLYRVSNSQQNIFDFSDKFLEIYYCF